MNEKIYKNSLNIKSSLSIRKRNDLIFKYGEEIYSRRHEDKNVVIDSILAKEKRELGAYSISVFIADYKDIFREANRKSYRII